MRITILTFGSRGDVQPFLPLSLRLMDEGHSVRLAAPFRFKSSIEEHGIDFVPLAGDPEDLSRRLNNAGHNFVKLLHEVMNHAVEIGADVWHQSEAACQDADLILNTFTHAVGGHTLAREKNIPDIHIQTFPMFTPTGDYPNITMPQGLPRLLNRFTHKFSSKITWWTSRIGMVIHHGGAGTTTAGLGAGIPNIVVPFMADQPFWGERVHSIGAGPKPIPVKNLSLETLTCSIAEAEDESIRKHAQAVGRKIRNEDGTGEAVKWIGKYSDDFNRWH